MNDWERYPYSQDRPTWSAAEGWVLHTDVFETAVSKPLRGDVAPEKILDIDAVFLAPEKAPTLEVAAQVAAQNPAGASVWLGAMMVAKKIPNPSNDFFNKYGVTEADLAHATPHTVIHAGFLEQAFPFYFSALTASSVVDHFVAEGRLAPEAAQNMTFTDWANIIGTGWFGKLMHAASFTGNGVYGTRGVVVEDYRPGALQEQVGLKTPLFESAEEFEKYEGTIYTTAGLTSEAKASLRRRKPDHSAGCPVRHVSTRLPAGLLNIDPHVRKLVESGRLTVGEPRPTSDKVRVKQEYTAIDDALIGFADWLERYDNLHGTPRIAADGSVVHIKQPPVDALRRPAPGPVAERGARFLLLRKILRRI